MFKKFFAISGIVVLFSLSGIGIANATGVVSCSYNGTVDIAKVYPVGTIIHYSGCINLVSLTNVTFGNVNASYSVVDFSHLDVTIPDGIYADVSVSLYTSSGESWSDSYWNTSGDVITTTTDFVAGTNVTFTDSRFVNNTILNVFFLPSGSIFDWVHRISIYPLSISGSNVTFTIPSGVSSGVFTFISANAIYNSGDGTGSISGFSNVSNDITSFGCFDSGWSILSPSGFAKMLVCVIKYVFVPTQSQLFDHVQALKNEVLARPPGSIIRVAVDSFSSMADGYSAHSCSGSLPYNFTPVYIMHSSTSTLKLSCSPPSSSSSIAMRTFEELFISLGLIWGLYNFAISIFRKGD